MCRERCVSLKFRLIALNNNATKVSLEIRKIATDVTSVSIEARNAPRVRRVDEISAIASYLIALQTSHSSDNSIEVTDAITCIQLAHDATDAKRREVAH